MGGRPTKALAAAGLLALVVGVLLARDGTAAGEQDLAGPAPATAGFPSLPPEPEPAPSVGVEDLGLDGIGGARLGPRPAASADGDGWFDTGTTSLDGRCSLLGYRGATPALAVTGWQVDGRVVSVAMLSRPVPPTDVPSAWGTTFGDDLDAVDFRAPATLTQEPVDGALVDEVRSVQLVRDGIEAVFSDVGSQAGIRYVEVREPAGRDCRTERWLYEPDATVPSDAPVLDAGGYGPVRFGQPVEELDALGLTPLPFGQEAPDLLGCQVWLPTDGMEPPGAAGLGRVLSVSGEVVAIRLDRGRTAEGLAVGDPADAVLSAYRELAVAGAYGGLTTPFPAPLADGRRVQVELRRPGVLPFTVDAPLESATQVVGSVELSTSACRD